MHASRNGIRVALTGATGVVGRFVAARLGREGCDVAALARPESDRTGFDFPIDWVEGDLSDKAAPGSLLRGADALVHSAYDHVPGHYRGGEGDDVESFWRTNLLGSLRLMHMADAFGVGRTVVLSSRAVFGRPSITRVGDTRATSPNTHYGALKVALEGLAGVYPRTTCLRPTGVYGVTHPASRSKWFDMARDVINARPITFARTSTEVHGDDVAAAVWLLLTAREADVAGRAFNCSDLTLSTREIAERMYAAHGAVAGPRPGLPKVMPPPDDIMRCDGLRALGWRPGGRRRLQATIRALLDAARRPD